MTDKPLRFSRIDETNIDLHSYLEAGDPCLFLREFTSRQGFSYSETNNLVSNLKKKRSDGGYHYKQPAIEQCAREIHAGLSETWLRVGTMVPVPPSKHTSDPGYDDRMLRVCQRIAAVAGFPVNVRELVVQKASREAAHAALRRPTVAELIANYEINEGAVDPAPTTIAILDDVLTSGTHFKAMEAVLSERFPGVPITGIFWTRRVFAPEAFGFVDET